MILANGFGAEWELELELELGTVLVMVLVLGLDSGVDGSEGGDSFGWMMVFARHAKSTRARRKNDGHTQSEVLVSVPVPVSVPIPTLLRLP